MAAKADPMDEFIAARRPNVHQCKVGEILQRLAPERSGALQKALNLGSDVQPAITIKMVLEKWGERVSETVIRQHRNTTCACQVDD